MKIRMKKTCSTASSTCTNVYFLKTIKSRFVVELQSFVFGLILADFGSLGQFWAKFATLVH
jgi:hypothetical protein